MMFVYLQGFAKRVIGQNQGGPKITRFELRCVYGNMRPRLFTAYHYAVPYSIEFI